MKKIMITTFASLMLLAVGAKQTDPSKAVRTNHTAAAAKQQPAPARVSNSKTVVVQTPEHEKRAAERANRNKSNPAWDAKVAQTKTSNKKK